MPKDFSAKAQKTSPSEPLDLARKTKRLLSADAVDDFVGQELQDWLRTSQPLKPSGKDSAELIELDKLGVAIWNIATRLHRDTKRSKFTLPLAVIRAFAFFLLDTAYNGISRKKQESADDSIRILRTSLKAAKSCIDDGKLELCSKVLQSAADYCSSLTGGDRVVTNKNDVDPTHIIAVELSAEFWLLRTALSWKQDRLDTAEHYLSKAAVPAEMGEPSTSLLEKTADLTHEIGRDLLRKKQFVPAMKWLQKSSDAIDQIATGNSSPDSSELRLNAVHDLIRALIGVRDKQSLARAADLVAFLEGEYGTKLAITMLKLQLLSCEDPIPADQYQRVIMNLINSTVLTDKTFKTIIHYIQQLRRFDPRLALKTLDDFLQIRLYEAGNQSYMEKTLVMRIWISCSEKMDMDIIDKLSDLLDQTRQSTNQTFGTEATHAAQTLIWKAIESSNSANETDIVERLCRIARHSIFKKAGDINKSKLARKMILNALAKNSMDPAREAYFQMPESGKEAMATKYLMYRVGLRSDDEELMSGSLASLVKGSDKNATYLFACVLEAQKYGSRKHVVDVLQNVLLKYNYCAPQGVYLPALLRCTAQLLIGELETDNSIVEDLLAEICKVFEAGAARLPLLRRTLKDESERDTYGAELGWFAKNSYNLALKHYASAHPQMTVRIIKTCLAFTRALCDAANDQEKAKLDRREMLCHFIAASACIVQARSEDNMSTAQQYYAASRKHAEAFTKIANNTRGSKQPTQVVAEDLSAKRAQLLKYELEAIVKLQRWAELEAVMDQCLQPDQGDHLETLADLILVVHESLVEAKADGLYSAKIAVVIQTIINQSWQRKTMSMKKLARWLRCVFRMSINGSPVLALNVMDQAVSIASRVQDYPSEEIEWMSTTAFNHAVDLFCALDHENCRNWAEKALNLAKTASDIPGLFTHMQSLWLKLQARGQER